MNGRSRGQYLSATLLAAALSLLPCAACADVYIAATGGSGPDGYRSTELDANADLLDSRVSASVFRFRSDSSTDSISQSGLQLNWKISSLVDISAAHNKQDNELVDISGNALQLVFNLHALWDSELATRIDLKRGNSVYRFNNLPAAVQNDTVNQTGSSVGLSQDIADTIAVSAAHDHYSYDRDPKRAAVHLMLLAPRRFFSTSSPLLAFPDYTNSIGITWWPLDALGVNISASRTTTLFQQEQLLKRLGMDYQVTDHLNLSAAVSRASVTAVVTRQAYLTIPAGTTVIPASNDTYGELGAGWTF